MGEIQAAHELTPVNRWLDYADFIETKKPEYRPARDFDSELSDDDKELIWDSAYHSQATWYKLLPANSWYWAFSGNEKMKTCPNCGHRIFVIPNCRPAKTFFREYWAQCWKCWKYIKYREFDHLEDIKPPKRIFNTLRSPSEDRVAFPPIRVIDAIKPDKNGNYIVRRGKQLIVFVPPSGMKIENLIFSGVTRLPTTEEAVEKYLQRALEKDKDVIAKINHVIDALRHTKNWLLHRERQEILNKYFERRLLSQGIKRLTAEELWDQIVISAVLLHLFPLREYDHEELYNLARQEIERDLLDGRTTDYTWFEFPQGNKEIPDVEERLRQPSKDVRGRSTLWPGETAILNRVARTEVITARQAKVIELYKQGHKQKEIAESLGTTQSSVSLMIKRAEFEMRSVYEGDTSPLLTYYRRTRTKKR